MAIRRVVPIPYCSCGSADVDFVTGGPPPSVAESARGTLSALLGTRGRDGSASIVKCRTCHNTFDYGAQAYHDEVHARCHAGGHPGPPGP